MIKCQEGRLNFVEPVFLCGVFLEISNFKEILLQRVGSLLKVCTLPFLYTKPYRSLRPVRFF